MERVAAGAPVFLSRRGRTCAVLLSAPEYERLVGREVTEPHGPCTEHRGESETLPARAAQERGMAESSPPDGSEAIGPRREMKVSPEEDVVRVLAAMKGARQGVTHDQLAQVTELPSQRVSVALLELHLNGFIEPGGLLAGYSVRSGG